MLFNKEQIALTLQEKANQKIEMLRHEMAQGLFESNLTEDIYFVFDKKSEEVAGGPFASNAKAKAYIAEMGSKDLVVMTEKALEKKMGITKEDLDEIAESEGLKVGTKVVYAKGTNQEVRGTIVEKVFGKGGGKLDKWIVKFVGGYIAPVDAIDLVKEDVVDEAAPNMKDGLSDPLNINAQYKRFKNTDAVISWFANAGYDGQQIDFNNKTGELKIKGVTVAVKGKNGSYSVDVTACGNVGLKMPGSEKGAVKYIK